MKPRYFGLLPLVFTVAILSFSLEHMDAAQRSPRIANTEELPPSAEEVASTTGMLPLFDRLKEIAGAPPSAEHQLELLSIHQQILESVVSTSLQVDATIAQIDNEIVQASELRGYLADKRDRTVNILNLSSIGAGGMLGIVSSSLQLSSHLAKAGDATGIVSGAVTSTLSAMGLKVQKGQDRHFGFPSNMLAELFNRPLEPTSKYPSPVWQFITSVAPTDPNKITRQQRLIRTWVDVKRIDPPGTPAGDKKINHVTSRPSDGYKLTIDDLEDRVAMLQDVRAKLSFMKRDLGLLLQTLPKTAFAAPQEQTKPE
jgi:hypothetical protein